MTKLTYCQYKLFGLKKNKKLHHYHSFYSHNNFFCHLVVVNWQQNEKSVIMKKKHRDEKQHKDYEFSWKFSCFLYELLIFYGFDEKLKFNEKNLKVFYENEISKVSLIEMKYFSDYVEILENIYFCAFLRWKQ